jgi:hypothetical protein
VLGLRKAAEGDGRAVDYVESDEESSEHDEDE